ncbi:helix-turn-helix domain-containing protein [Pseudomonas umsongensis]|nr:LexA family transcriptional regulator [Pseudomonas umsongensis]MCK8685335.1 helix-turn-helix domain-containing protein [Pseudomonas umsongensis]
MSGKGWSEGELSRRSGVTQPTIHRIITGESKSPKRDNVERIAKALRVPAEWLWVGGVRPDLANEPLSNVELALQPTRSFSYPEISWVQAGSAMEAVELSNVAACPRHTSDVWAGDNGFWLRVVGASMTSSSGDSFPEGFLILVAPDIEPRHGQYVVARMIDTNEATFKQLVRDAGELYLKPLNPSYPTKPIDDAWEVVGTVVDGKMPKSVFF